MKILLSSMSNIQPHFFFTKLTSKNARKVWDEITITKLQWLHHSSLPMDG